MVTQYLSRKVRLAVDASVDIVCLVLDSYVIFRLPIKKKSQNSLTLFKSYSSSVISIWVATLLVTDQEQQQGPIMKMLFIVTNGFLM